MLFISKRAVFLASLMVLTLFAPGFGQTTNPTAKGNDGTDLQRLDVMRDKLDRMRRSLNSSISVLKDETKDDKKKKDDKESVGTPLGRLQELDKDVARLQSDVSNLHGKLERSEKYQSADVGSLEQSVSEVQARVDKAQLETATERSNPLNQVDKSGDNKKSGKLFGIFGKGGKDEYQELIGTVKPGRDRELFIVATREVRKGNNDVGRLLFQTIITTYPDSSYLPMSKLAIGDSFYLEGSSSSLIQAIAAYNDWLTFFPTHPLADRVILKIAESEMRQVGLPDRQATNAKRAETRLKALLQQYPNSILKEDAEERLRQVQDNLGLHNLLIANYYYALAVDQKKGGLKGAQSRYREIMDKYPDFCFMDQALYKIAVTYLVEEETDQAARYFQRIVTDYPNSEWTEKSKEQLQLIGALVPVPNPARVNITPCAEPSFFQNFKNQFFGVYPMTIDKDGVLMTHNFSKEKFEMIDQIIENQGDILANQIPKALTTVIRQTTPETKATTQQAPPVKQPEVPGALTDTKPKPAGSAIKP